MVKLELIKIVAEKCNLTERGASNAVEAFVEAIKHSIQREEPVVIRGFGTLAVKERAARKRFSPLTREIFEVSSKKVVKFKPSKGLLKKEALTNSSRSKKN